MKSVPTISFIKIMFSFVEYQLLQTKNTYLSCEKTKKTLHNNLMRVMYVCPFFRFNVNMWNKRNGYNSIRIISAVNRFEASTIGTFVKRAKKQNRITEKKNEKKIQ